MESPDLPLSAEALLARAQEQISDLRRQDDQLRRTAEGISAKRVGLANEIAKVETAIEVFAALLPKESQLKKAAGFVLRIAASLIMAGTIGDAAERFMAANGGKAAVTELVTAFQEAGRVTDDGKAAYRVLYATLDRDPRFERLSPGVYGLRLPLTPEAIARIGGSAHTNGTSHITFYDGPPIINAKEEPTHVTS